MATYVRSYVRPYVRFITMKKYIRKITKASSHSYTINIPKEVFEAMKLREKQKLEIIFDAKKRSFVVKDWKK